MKGYDALECTLISRGYAGKHLGRLRELSFLADKVAWFLFEFSADDYKGLELPVIPPYALCKQLGHSQTIEVTPRMYLKTSKYFYFISILSKKYLILSKFT